MSEPLTPSPPSTARDPRGRDAALAPAPPRPRRKGRRWLVWATVLLLLLATGLYVTYRRLSDPQRLARMAEAAIAEMVGGRVHVESGQFGLRTITLTGVEVRVIGLPDGPNRLFAADQVLVEHNVWSLLTGQLDPRRVVLVRPRVYLCENLDTGEFNLQAHQRSRPAGAAKPPTSLPELVLNDGALIFGQVRNGQYQEQQRVNLAASVLPASGRPGWYRFVLSPRGTSAQPTLPDLAGEFDLATMAAQARFEPLVCDDRLARLLPAQLRQWWERHRPEGQLDSVRLSYEPGRGGGAPTISGAVESRDLALTLFYGPDGQSQSRLKLDAGRAEFRSQGPVSTGRHRLRLHGLSATIEKWRCRFEGEIRGFDDQAPMDLVLEVAGHITPAPKYRPGLPEVVTRYLDRFSPDGPLAARIALRRQQKGGPLQLGPDSHLDLRGLAAAWEVFPYPLREVTGRIDLSDAQVTARGLTARTGPGDPVTIDVEVTPPVDAGKHVIEVSTALAVDDLLRKALQPGDRALLDSFVSPTRYQELLDKSLIQSKAQHQQRRAELEALKLLAMSHRDEDPEAMLRRAQRIAELETLAALPVFDLGGKMGLDLTVSRPAGVGEGFAAVISLRLDGASALMADWPYPLLVEKGTVVVRPGAADLGRMTLVSPTGAKATLEGKLLPAKGNPAWLQPHLTLDVRELPIDQLLKNTLPADSVKQMDDLGLTGVISGKGPLSHDEKGNLKYAFDARLEGGTLGPRDRGFRLTKVAGTLALDPGGISFKDLAAQYRKAAVMLNGTVRWDAQPVAYEVTATGQGVHWDDPLEEFFPAGDPIAARLQALRKEHKPAGEFDLRARLGSPAGKPAYFGLELEPRSLALDYGGQRLELSGIEGRLVIDEQAIELHDVAAQVGETWASAKGKVILADGALDLHLAARDKEIGPVTRLFLPAGLAQTLDSLKLQGAYEVRRAHLVTTPTRSASTLPSGAGVATAPAATTQPGSVEVAFEGELALRSASADLGVAFTELDADIQLDLTQRSGEARSRLDMRADLPQFRAAGRRFTGASFRLVSDREDPGRLRIRELAGACYGGTLSGEADFVLAEPGSYLFRLALQDVALEPFAHPDQDHLWKPRPSATQPATSAPGPSATPAASGVLSGNLTFEGRLGDDQALRGKGDVLIEQPQVGQVPLGLAILDVLNLKWPSTAGFDATTARFSVDGDQVTFDSVRLEAPTLEVAGRGGTMKLSTLELDLLLYSRDPKALFTGPLPDFVDFLKKQLVAIKVTGTLDKPKAAASPLHDVRRVWDDIFVGGVKPRAITPQP